jgi:hypothetical protein
MEDSNKFVNESSNVLDRFLNVFIIDDALFDIRSRQRRGA